MQKRHCVLLLVAFGLNSQAQPESQASELQRCAHIKDSGMRLACYDAAVLRTASPPRAAIVDDLPAPSSSQMADALAADAAKPLKLDDASFGLPKQRDNTETREIQSITGPDFNQWGPNERIHLENGQVWQVTDGSRGTLINVPAKVTVKKGLFGSYFMVFQERNFSPRVKRIR